MPAPSTLPFITVVIISLIFIPSPSFSSSPHETSSRDGIGFSARLIHRNSVRSPFYNPNLTQSDRIREAIHSSFSRQRYLQSIINSKEASPNFIRPLVSSQGKEYVLTYYIGTPPIQTYAIIDTASDLLWLQCLPCEDCFPQKSEPIFDPSKSQSFQNISCEDDNCKLLSTNTCNNATKNCHYGIKYGDSSTSDGDLALETLIFGDDLPGHPNITLLNMLFGCGHKNVDVVKDGEQIPGVIGLSRHPISFNSQLYNESFSYCFLPKTDNEDGVMSFGLSAVITSETTPILDVGNGEYYYLSLEGISVANETLPIPPGSFNVTKNGRGGFMIDSGTTISLLNYDVFPLLIAALEKKITVLKKVEDPYRELRLCYEGTFSDISKASPNIFFHFKGVKVMLDALRTWVDTGKGSYCLAMLPAEMSIFGNCQQQNLNIGYDLSRNVISFEERACNIA